MKQLTQMALIIFCMIMMPKFNFAQAPNLGSAGSFAAFTAAGAFNSVGTTVITGDIGTHVGAFSGFPPGVVMGTIHVADAVTALAATDVVNAYNAVAGLICGAVLGVTMGSGQTLTPNIYCTGAATTLNGNLILDAQGDPDALFIFQIDGAFATGTFASVTLINGASLCNVYWQINGEFDLGDFSTFLGTALVEGAINLLEGSSVTGRVLSTQGAISLHSNLITIGLPTVAAVITANGPTTFCIGGSVILSGNIDGIWNTGATTPSIVVTTGGEYFVTNTGVCGVAESNHIIVTVNPLPVCSITGDLSICQGETTELCAPAGLSYLWSNGAITQCITVSTAGIYTATITDANGCSSTCSVEVTVNALPVCFITGNLSLCQGLTTELCAPAGAAGYLWSTGAITGCITVNVAGTYTVTLVYTNGCTNTCSATVVVNPLPVCTITGDLLICDGASTQLCASPGAAGYLWSNGAITQCITVDVAGTYTATITDVNGCSSTCSATVVVNPLPVCTITGDLLICDGASTQLCVPAGAAGYLWSNGATANCITVSLPGVYSVIVTEINGCIGTCSATVVVNPQLGCTITGELLLCEGTTTELCVPAGAAGYLWSNGATANCITVSLPGVYSVIVTQINGCVSTCSATVVTLPLPVCFITGNLSLCQGETTELCAPAGAAGYMWSTGAITQCISVSTPGIYNVTTTDANGCTSTCSVEVSVDMIPVCTITGNLLLCEGTTTELCVPAGAVGYLWSNGATTNCITVSLPGVYSVIVTEINGCNSTCSATVVVSPLPICSITGNLSICPGASTMLCAPAGFAGYLWSTGATTNCITASTAGIYSVIVTDINGCSSTCSVTVAVDSTPPVITCPADLTLECDDSTLPAATGTATATDDCTLVPTITFSDLVTTGTCPQEYTITRTWTATDAAGNSAICVQTITVLDDTPPVITLPNGLLTGDTMKIQCYGQNPEWDLPAFDENSVQVTDNCTGPVTVVLNRSLPIEGNCMGGFINLYRLTWTATDGCGNLDSAVLFLALVDTIPPVIFGVPADTTVNCDEIPPVPFSIYATDECLCACVVLLEETMPLPGCQFGQVLVRTWIAKDDCGNQTIATQNITLIDNKPPVFVGVLDTACINDPALLNVVAIDDCGGAVVLTYQDFNTPNPCGEGMAILRIYEASDACGNVARDSSILLPVEQSLSGLVFANPVLAALDSGEIMILNLATWNGHYTTFGIHDVNIEGACFSGGYVNFTERVLQAGDCMVVLELKWIAIDICGNYSELIVIAHMMDQSSPVFINFIPEMTIGCDEAMPESLGFDNSGVVTMTVTDTTILSDCIYDYDVLRTITLRDSCDNTATRQQIIHVRSRAPIIHGVDEEICDDFSIPVVTAYDPCAGEFVAVTMREDTLNLLPCSGLSVLRTWSAVGSCGQVSVIRQTIISDDNTPPVYIIPAQSVIWSFMNNEHNLVLTSQTNLINALNALNANSVLFVDDCDPEITAVLTAKVTYAEDCEAEGYLEQRTYTWMAEDACGNRTVFGFMVDIMDDVPPTFSVTPADVTIVCAPLPPVPDVNPVDLAQPATIAYTETIVPGSAAGTYIVTRTWVARDACGNTSTYVQHITWIPDNFLECEIIVPEIVECNSHGVIISSVVPGGVGPLTYYWEIVGDDCFIQGGQGASEVMIYVGWTEVTINLTVTDEFGCVSVCTYILDCVTLPNIADAPGVATPLMNIINTPESGVTQERGTRDNLQQIKLWPNPSSGTVNLSFESTLEEVVEFRLINLLGQVVLMDKISAQKGFNIVKIDAALVADGSHLVQVKTDQEVHTKVVVIMKFD
jgi:hypothetical protein